MDIKHNKNSSNFIFQNIVSVKSKIFWFKKYKKSFLNYLSVSKNVTLGKFQITLILKNGKKIKAKTRDVVALYALTESNKNYNYSESDDLLKISFNKQETTVNLYGISKSIDAIMTFGELNPYYKLNIKNKTVIDIGGSIGDSAIFFAVNGSKKIIYVEPYPVNFEFAKKNVFVNNLTEKIKLNLGSCGSKSGTIEIDPNTQSSMRTILKETKSKFFITQFTLEDLVDKYDTNDLVLKMDCEGCEYESILNTSDIILKKFESIVIEFHSGYKNLKNKLQNAGFDISEIIQESKNYGYLIAIRK